MTKSRAPDQEKSGTDHFEKSPILLPSPLLSHLSLFCNTEKRICVLSVRSFPSLHLSIHLSIHPLCNLQTLSVRRRNFFALHLPSISIHRSFLHKPLSSCKAASSGERAIGSAWSSVTSCGESRGNPLHTWGIRCGPGRRWIGTPSTPSPCPQDACGKSTMRGNPPPADWAA